MAPWLLALVALLCSLRAAAHPMPESQVWIDTAPDGITLTLRLPLNRLEFAFGQLLSEEPAQVLERHGERLSRYLLSHVGLRSGAAGWTVLRPALAVVGPGASAELEAVLQAKAPVGADPRHFSLLYDVITHEVRTHRVMVFLRNDWAGGHVGEPPRHLGELTPATTQLAVALDAEGAGASVLKLFRLGATHIAEGTDHLLFLLTLLLVAPVAASGGHWAQARPVHAAARRIVAIVTAFTIGHSATLALGSTGLVELPPQWVETAVAASILVAAVRAWRPLWASGEFAIAGGFGLLHGLAFSASLSSGGLTAAQHAQALLSFNLGIEAMQLVVVACAMPPLLVLAAKAPVAYGRLRAAGALLAAVLAGIWVVERLLPEAPQVVEGGLRIEPLLAQLACAASWAVAAVLLFKRR